MNSENEITMIPIDYHPPLGDIPVLYRDDDILVLDKPSGLLHVPGRDPRLKDCLDSRIRMIFPTASVIHRLDRDTSGVVVMGLNKRAHADIAMQFETRTTEKFYIARVYGHVIGEDGLIDLPLAIDPDHKPRHRVDPVHGRSAQTHWRVLSRDDNATRMHLSPLTGRTHQLRVHMLSMGHPILGDPLYATGDALGMAARLQLHAAMLSFCHPSTGRQQVFESPCPF